MAADGSDEQQPEPTAPASGPDTPPEHPAGAEVPGVPDIPGAGHGETAQMPPADPWAGETELRPPLPDATRADIPPAGAPGDAPVDRGPGGTGVLPSVPAASAPEPRWSARAQVRPPDRGGPVDEEEWTDPGRSPWVPVLVAVGILILVGLLVVGVLLLVNNQDDPDEVTPPPTGDATSQPVIPTTTTAARSSAAPSSAAPAEVAIPDVKGRTYEQAAAALQEAGFVPNRVDEVSAQQPAGRVVGTNPGAGTKLRPGTRVDVIVSKGVASATPTASPSRSAAPSSSGPGG